MKTLDTGTLEKLVGQAPAPPSHGGNGDGVIERFNTHHTVIEMLERFGYTPAGLNRYNHPSGAGRSVTVAPDGAVSFHHSPDDPLFDDRRDCAVRDAFDIFRILGHGGDVKAACVAAHDEESGSIPDLPEPEAEPMPIMAIAPESPICPALPDVARLPDELGRNASPWLDSYIQYSRYWSPRAFDGFHEACGLWLLSLIAARRVVLHLGKPFYTLLYIALTARTSLFAKSTTADVAADLLRAAGLSWLLAADDSTPQKFIRDLTISLPEGFDQLAPDVQDRWRLRLAFAGQRGWFYEEFGQHLESITREGGYMGEFRGLLRRFDDCKPRFEYGTIGRGTDVIERPYLALLASMTPADMRPIARRNAAMWNDGFFARFAFVTPPGDERKRERFPAAERIIPPELTTPLRDWHYRLGIPAVSITDVADEDGKPTGKKQVEVEARKPASCTVGPDVVDAFYRYHDALLDLVAENETQDLDGNYARFAEKALRVAILLASLENGNVIELRHWARAQAIAERWRANLHSLFEQVNQPDPSEDSIAEEKVLRVVQRQGWVTPREVGQRIRGLGTSDAARILQGLVGSGVLTTRKGKRTERFGFPSDSEV